LSFELETKVEIQVSVESECLAGQTYFLQPFPPEGKAIGLHRIHIPALTLSVVEMVHVCSPQSKWTCNSNGLVFERLLNRTEYIAIYFNACIQHYDNLAKTLL
jgi:hypothetical protein